MQQWEPMMVLKYANLLVPFYYKNLVKFVIKVILDYKGWQFINFQKQKQYSIRENKKELAKIISRIRLNTNNSKKQQKNRKLSRRNFELKR